MSKPIWGFFVSTAFAVGLTVSPLPEQWRTPVVIAAWTICGIATIGWIFAHFRDKWRQRRFSFTYAYGLALEGIQIGRDDTNPEGHALQLSLILRNAADGPLKFYVEQLDVIIGDRAIANPTFTNRGGVISRGSKAMFSYPAFGREATQGRSRGVIRYSIIYGHPEIGFSRRGKKELGFNMRADEQVTGLHYVIQSECDEEIKITIKPPL